MRRGRRFILLSMLKLRAKNYDELNFEIVTFERIFDVQRKFPIRYSKSTLFSFEDKGRSHYALEAYGWPNLQEGDCVALAMRELGNTQTLVGWKNMTTGELVVPSAKRKFIDAVKCAVLLPVGFLYFYDATSKVGRVAAGFFLGCVLVGFLTSIYKTFRRVRDARLIRSYESPLL